MNVKIITGILISGFFLHGCATTSPTKTVPAELYKKELLRFGVPKGWIQVYRVKKDNMTMYEVVPQGQKADNWKEMITLQTFSGGIKKSTTQFADAMRAGWVKLCPGGKAFPGRDGTENGYHFSFWLQSCGHNPLTRKPEITLVKAVEGNDSFYVIQKAWSYMPAKEEITRWSKFMRRIELCDSRIDERKCPF